VTFISAFVALLGLSWLVFFALGPLLERILSAAAHRTAKFRYHDYLPVLVLLGAGVAASAMAGDAFIDIAERVHSESPQLRAVDTAMHAWAHETRTDGSTTFFTLMTVIGTPVGLGVLVVLVCGALVAARRFRWAAYLAITTVIGGLLNLLLKAQFARARPDLAEALRGAHGYSFPSGHAMGSTIVFGALGYLAFRVLHRWRWRAFALAFCFTMMAAIAASRIYLGVHWISDVAAGMAAGLIWLAVTTIAYETTRRIRLVRSLRIKAGMPASPPKDEATTKTRPLP
jgi:membrane-associated phospholipid phosphatase